MFLCNISLQPVLLVKKKGEGYFWPLYFSFFMSNSSHHSRRAAEAWEEVAMEAEAEEVTMEAEAEVVEAESPMEAAEGESLCFGCC